MLYVDLHHVPASEYRVVQLETVVDSDAACHWPESGRVT